MLKHTIKTSDSQSKAASAREARKEDSNHSASLFEDNRPETVTRKNLQAMADSGPQSMQLKSFQQMADVSPQVQRTAQLQAMTGKGTAQRQGSLEEEPAQNKAVRNPVQLAAKDEELQKKADPAQKQGLIEPENPIPANQNSTGLPDNVKTGVESLSGTSLDDVRVHYNSPKPSQLQALAHTQGTDIHVAPGQEKHLAHEAWHVAQQKQGRVKPTIEMAGTPVNDNASLEHEADVMGRKAVQASSRTATQRKLQDGAGNSSRVKQLKNHRAAKHGGSVVQAMKVRGTASPSQVSGTTHGKHVVAAAGQAAAAQANYGSTTFVTTDAALTGAVDADGHDFTEVNGTASGRYDFNANVNIYQYDKTNAPPAGLAKTQPVNKTIDNVSTSCEIGAKKGGDDIIKVTHFKKN